MTVTLTVDEAGAEYKVETGSGVITRVDRRDDRVHVSVRAPHLAELVTGSLPALGLGDAAHAQLTVGLHVAYRIHVRRRAGIETSIPFAELLAGDKVRTIVLITPKVSDGNLEVSGDALAAASTLAKVAANSSAAASLLISAHPLAKRLESSASVLLAIARTLEAAR